MAHINPIRSIEGSPSIHYPEPISKEEYLGILKKTESEKLRNERYSDKQMSAVAANGVDPRNQIDTIDESSSEEGAAKPKKKESPTSSLSNLNSWLWGQIIGLFIPKSDDAEKNAEVQGVETIGGKPKLEAPKTEIDKRNLTKLITEMRELLNTIKKSVEESELELQDERQKTEMLVWLLMLKSVKMQQQLKEEEIMLGKDSVAKFHADVVEIREQYFNLRKEIIDRAKTSKVLGWVSTALTASILAVISAGLVASAVASAGATAPIAAAAVIKTTLFVAGAGLSVASGSVGITKAVISKKDGEQKAEATQLIHDRKKFSLELKDYMKLIGDDFEKFLELVSMLRQIAENDQKAKSAQIA